MNASVIIIEYSSSPTVAKYSFSRFRVKEYQILLSARRDAMISASEGEGAGDEFEWNILSASVSMFIPLSSSISANRAVTMSLSASARVALLKSNNRTAAATS